VTGSLLVAEEQRTAVSTTLAARLLGKSRDTIYRWLAEGRLAGRKVGGRWIVYRDSVEAEWEGGLVEAVKERARDQVSAGPPRARRRPRSGP